MFKQSVFVAMLLALMASGCSSEDQEKEQKAGTRFDAIDKDSDGVITQKEFIKRARIVTRKQFTKADGDKDGVLTKKEFSQAQQKMRERLKKKGLSKEEIALRIKDKFTRFDKNSDGKISKEEYMKQTINSKKKAFKKKDANGDGKLTPKEFSAKPQSA